MSAEHYFLGIDAGTTSMKAAMFDAQGCLLGVDRQEYRLSTPGPALVELEPELYWQACCGAVRGALAQAGVDPGQVAALAISSQGETLVPLDAAGQPTRSAIVWLDNRATAEAAEIAGQWRLPGRRARYCGCAATSPRSSRARPTGCCSKITCCTGSPAATSPT
jgi:xylulokinase